MILIAYLLISAVAIALIAKSRSNRQMNAVAVMHSLIFCTITAVLMITGNIPVSAFLVGSEFFFIDHLGICEALISTIIFTLAAIYAGGYVESLLALGELRRGSLRLFYACWILLLLVITLAFFSDNLALFWIFAEMTTIISAMLVAILSARENIDAAIKYIFIASAAMLFSFAGFIFLFEVSRTASGEGSLNWTVLMQHAATYPPGMMTVVFILVFIGFAAKSGIFPFHTWLPEAHAKAPSAVSAVLSGVLLNIGIYAILRMTAIIHLNPASAVAYQVMMVFGIFTIGIAALSMLPQKNLKKLIAFSSIENMGLMVIGCAVMTPLAIFWVIFHIMAHTFTKAGLFFSAGILHRQYHSPFSGEAPDEIQDIFRLQPLAAWGIILGGLAITAIPPSPLFFSEIFILAQLGTQSLFFAILVLLLLFIAAASLGYFIIVAFTRKQENSNGDSHSVGTAPYITPVGMKVPIIILVIAVAGLGILVPGPVSGIIHQIVAELRF